MADESHPNGLPASASRSQWRHQLRADQAERWQRGERVLVETYLEQFPSLRADAEALLDLVFSEVVLRERLGESPRLEEYVLRFPAHEAYLRLQFALHEALAAASLSSP